MAAPVAGYVQLPVDTPNTGKKNRTQTKTVGSDTVHEHYVVPSPGYTQLGRYMASSTAPRTVAATSQTPTTSGYVFLHMSTAATGVVGVLREVSIGWSQSGTPVPSPTAPLIAVQKYTFAGAHNAATTFDIAKSQTSQAAPSANVRNAPTGTVLTIGNQIAALAVPAMESSVGTYGGYATIYRDDSLTRGNAVEFSTGEGIAVWQPNAGTGSDTRVITIKMVWDEVDVS